MLPSAALSVSKQNALHLDSSRDASCAASSAANLCGQQPLCTLLKGKRPIAACPQLCLFPGFCSRRSALSFLTPDGEAVHAPRVQPYSPCSPCSARLRGQELCVANSTAGRINGGRVECEAGSVTDRPVGGPLCGSLKVLLAAPSSLVFQQGSSLLQIFNFVNLEHEIILRKNLVQASGLHLT